MESFLGVEDNFLNGENKNRANLYTIDLDLGLLKEMEILSEFRRWHQKVAKEKGKVLGQCLLRKKPLRQEVPEWRRIQK